MSKGEIVGHIADGKYRVRQKLAVEKIKEELNELNARIAELAVELPEAKLALLQADDAVKGKVREIDLAIPDLQAGVDGARARITKLQTELVQLRATARLADLRVSELISENLAVLKRRNKLESVPEGRELELWCADYTLDLSGEVGLVDVNDEGGQAVIIQPGYANEAVYDAARDGALFPGIGQSGAQIYLNAAILPGVQKWLPRYRVGEIIRIQADICTVVLDPAVSSAQGLPINQIDTLTDIPIVYMDCDGSAFKKGDRVLVRFTSNGPLVIGFEKEPVPCSLFSFVFEPAKYDGVAGTNYVAQKETYGEPFESSGTPINPPLGTADGLNNAWTAIPNAADLVIERGKARYYGNKNWFNNEKLVLSWSGPPGRAHRMDQLDFGLSGFQEDWKTQPYVFHDLNIILDISTEAAAGSFDNVFGAAVHEDGQGQRWLIVVASDKEFIPLDVRESLPGQSFKVFRVSVDAAMQPVGPLELLHQYTLPVEMTYQSHFYFSEGGDKAVCTIVGDLLDPDNLHIDLLRYDLQTGFSLEQIWSRTDPVGAIIESSTWVQENNTSTGGLLTKDGTLNRNYQTSTHNIPIYCDYVGNQEVIAYEQRPGVYSVRSAVYRYESGDTDNSREYPAPITEWSGSETVNETQSGQFAIVTNDGRTLFRMPHQPQQISSFQYDYYQVATVSGTDTSGDSYVQEGYGTFTLSNDVIARVGGIDWEENLLAIDVRFDFCAVAYGGYQYNLNESISTSYDDPGFSTGGVTADGSISGNEVIEVVEFWLGGAMAMQEEAIRFDGPIQIGAYGVDPINQLGITGSNTSSQLDVMPELPLKIGSKYLMTAAGYRSGPHSIASVAMNYRTGATTRKAVLLNHVSGYSDPVQDILERSELNGFLLCSVGLI